MRALLLPWIGCALIGTSTQISGQPVDPAINEDEVEIVVIARKLKNWKGSVRDRDGTIECRTVRTSGDPAIDELGCRALRTCFTEHHPALTEAANAERRSRKQRVAQTNRELGACLVARRDKLIREFADTH